MNIEDKQVIQWQKLKIKIQAKRIEELERVLMVDQASLKGIKFIAQRKEEENTKLKEEIKELKFINSELVKLQLTNP